MIFENKPLSEKELEQKEEEFKAELKEATADFRDIAKKRKINFFKYKNFKTYYNCDDKYQDWNDFDIYSLTDLKFILNIFKSEKNRFYDPVNDLPSDTDPLYHKYNQYLSNKKEDIYELEKVFAQKYYNLISNYQTLLFLEAYKQIILRKEGIEFSEDKIIDYLTNNPKELSKNIPAQELLLFKKNTPENFLLKRIKSLLWFETFDKTEPKRNLIKMIILEHNLHGIPFEVNPDYIMQIFNYKNRQHVKYLLDDLSKSAEIFLIKRDNIFQAICVDVKLVDMLFNYENENFSRVLIDFYHFQNKELSFNEWFTYCMIKRDVLYHNFSKVNCEDIQNWFSVTKRHAQNYLKTLKEEQLIIIDKPKYKSIENIITLNKPIREQLL